MHHLECLSHHIHHNHQLLQLIHTLHHTLMGQLLRIHILNLHYHRSHKHHLEYQNHHIHHNHLLRHYHRNHPHNHFANNFHHQHLHQYYNYRLLNLCNHKQCFQFLSRDHKSNQPLLHLDQKKLHLECILLI